MYYYQPESFANHKEAKDRLNFVRKVYTILSTQLLITSFLSLLAILSQSLQEFLHSNLWFLLLCLVGAFTSLLFLFCFPTLSRNVPYNYVLLSSFTVFEGLIAASLTSLFEGVEVLIAVALTAGVVCLLTLYAFAAKTDFTTKYGLFLVLGFAMLALGLLFLVYSGGVLIKVSAK